MSTLAQSINRLYKAGRLTKEQVAERVEKGSITPEDYKKITGETYTAN